MWLLLHARDFFSRCYTSRRHIVALPICNIGTCPLERKHLYEPKPKKAKYDPGERMPFVQHEGPQWPDIQKAPKQKRDPAAASSTSLDATDNNSESIADNHIALVLWPPPARRPSRPTRTSLRWHGLECFFRVH